MKKIVSIFVCMLMIISILPNLCSKTINYNQINSDYYEYSSNSYLINTDWGEKSPYNEKCPMNNQPGRPSYRNRLGCWSVAIGTIINYHQLQSQGIVDYTCTHWYIDPQHIQNNLDEHVYDWSKMISEPHVSATDEELDNISQLLYDTATVIQKDFGTGWYKTVENTNDVPDLIYELLEHYDNITSFTKWVNELTEVDVKYEIDHNRPIMFYSVWTHSISDKSGGHAVVLDGYRYNTSSERAKFEVHIHWGWGVDNPPLNNCWYYFYDECYVNDFIFHWDDTRKGLFIRLYPDSPSLVGPIEGKPKKEYNFTSTTIYDVNPHLYYKFDWGDGTSTGWLGRYNSGEICVASHSWKEKGVYNIRVKAKDIDGWESAWSNPLAFSISKSKSYINPLQLFLQGFFHRFPLYEKILNHLV